MTALDTFGRPKNWRFNLDRECRDVSVGIAAVCEDPAKNTPRIILCSDWRVGSYLGSAETKHKQPWLPFGFTCLIAGDPREAEAVILKLREKFSGAGAINETNGRPLVEQAVVERLKERRDALAQGRFSMTHNEVMQFGRERLPGELFVKYLNDSGRLGFDVELIVAGFADQGDEILIEVQQNAVTMLNDFACIGEGAFLARASLLRRSISTVTDIGRAAYMVYEAKKAAERVDSVGKNTLLSMLEHKESRKSVPHDKIEYFDKQFEQYGPKPIPSLGPLPRGLFS